MHRAFTLIEQLAALALSSLFMVAAAGVLAGMARDRASPVRQPDAALGRAAERIRTDLLDARRMTIGLDQITLCGFDSLDPHTLAPDHRPVRVIYRIEHDEGQSRLIRRQESLDLLSNHNAWSELVCNDVANLEVILVTVPPPPTTRPWADPFRASDGIEIPPALRLRLTPANPGEPGIDRVLCVR
jgi:prepilin-type N-terminal cleavage/methylation domain-containing protein